MGSDQTTDEQFAVRYAAEVYETVDGFIDHVQSLPAEIRHHTPVHLKVPLTLTRATMLLAALRLVKNLNEDKPNFQEFLADLAQSVMCQATQAEREAGKLAKGEE